MSSAGCGGGFAARAQQRLRQAPLPLPNRPRFMKSPMVLWWSWKGHARYAHVITRLVDTGEHELVWVRDRVARIEMLAVLDKTARTPGVVAQEQHNRPCHLQRVAGDAAGSAERAREMHWAARTGPLPEAQNARDLFRLRHLDLVETEDVRLPVNVLDDRLHVGHVLTCRNHAPGWDHVFIGGQA